ncbi:MAG: Ig-like domain repeat protein [Solirubrobacterales bacterium]|nr:Ig-like domain repeat protein [Solirubrobacterales bacterium]
MKGKPWRRPLISTVLFFAIVAWWVLPATAEAAPTAIGLQLSPASVVANGTSTASATATVTDATSTGSSGETVSFTAAGDAVTLSASSCITGATGACTVTITSSTTVGATTITAADANLPPGSRSASASLIQSAGPAAKVTVQLNPPTIVANGTSATTATAIVTDAQGHRLPNETQVAFTSSASNQIGPSKNAGNGKYTATITSTTAVGLATITATDRSGSPAVSGSATLIQTAGPPAFVSVKLNPPTILANGTSLTIATAAVADALGHPLPTESVTFRSSDPGQFFGQVSPHGDGSYSVQIRGSTTAGPSTITATDGSVSGQATLFQAPGPSTTSLSVFPAAPVTNETVTLVATVTSAGSPSGTITFTNGAAPIVNCVGVPISPSHATAACQTSFAASASPVQAAATFTPDTASTAPGSTGNLILPVSPDSTSVSLSVSTPATVHQSTTITAVVTPPTTRPGPVKPSGSVEFFADGTSIPSCGAQAVVNSTATCTLTYNAPGQHTITAVYGGDSNFGRSTSPAVIESVVLPRAPILGNVRSTMEWTFSYTASYTKVLLLLVNGAATGDSVVVTCHGRGCPFRSRTSKIARRHCTRKKAKRTCRGGGGSDLTPLFRGHRLFPAAKITVLIARPQWIGKYYAFTIRARRGPRIQVTCMAPARVKPGVGCL